MAKKDLDWMVETASKLYRRGMEVREAALEAVRQAGINEPDSVETFQRTICSRLGKRGAERKKMIAAGRKRVAEIQKMQEERRQRQAALNAASKIVLVPAVAPAPVAVQPSPATRRKGKGPRGAGQMKIYFS